MSRLSLIMGIFFATAVTSIITLMAVTSNVSNQTILYRGTVIFFIFGFLGTFFGSFLEVMFMPAWDKHETANLQKEVSDNDEEFKKEIGDLLEESEIKLNQSESGTPTDDTRLGTAMDGQ